MTHRTPIALITGSLGSGKTTLLQKILEKTDHRLAVMMNEFGEIAIDSRVIQGENVRIVELAGGCVCCELTGELEAGVEEIIEKARPDYILVEATGVAEADALVYEVEDNLPKVRLDSVICVVDAYTSTRFPQVGYTARTQLDAADLVLVNKTDLVNAKEGESVMAQIRKYNPTAPVLKSVRCNVDISLLFGPDLRRSSSSIPRPAHHEFESFSFSTSKMLAEEKFQRLMAGLSPKVYRAKGFVRFENSSYLFNYVMGRTDLAAFKADRTQLVFIGPRLHDIQDPILNGLRGCEV